MKDIQLKAAIYARVSSKEQEETGYSLPAQEKLLKEDGSRKGLKIEKVFSIAESASGSTQRKVFAEMMEYVSKNNINILLCEKVDRITRNFKEAVVINDWLEENPDRQIHFVKQNLIIHKDAKSDEKFRWDIEIVLAKKYISNLSEEVKKGQKEKIAQGWLPTTPPVGYQTVGEKGHKIHVVDETMTPLVKQMFELYATGNYSTEALAKKMFSLGLRNRNGNKIVKSRIHELLKDHFYYGKMSWKGEIYDGAHSPLITKELFLKVQTQLSRGTDSPYYSKQIRELQGKIHCAECGKTVTWETQKGHVYGGCKQCKTQLGKNRKYIRQEELEDDLFAQICHVAPKNEKVLAVLEKALKEDHSEEIERYEAQTKSLNDQLTRIQQRMSVMYDDKLDGRITAEMYDTKLKDFKNQSEDIESTLKRLRNDNIDHYETGFAIHELALRAYDIYKSEKALIDDRRLLLSYAFSNVSISRGEITVEFTKAFEFMADYIPPVNEALELEESVDYKGQKTPFDVSHPVLLRG